MNDMTEAPTRGLGDNNPPIDLRTDLLERFAEPLKEANDALAAAKEVPAEVDNDEIAKTVADIVKAMAAHKKKLDGLRDTERKPYGDAFDTISATFDNVTRDLENWRKTIKQRGADYTDRKRRAEEKRLEEEAAEKRRVAAVAAARAEEAERTRNQASIQLGEFERLTNEAKLARLNAITDVDVKVADLTQAKADLQKIKFEASQLAADFALAIQKGETVTKEDKDAKRAEFETRIDAAKVKVTEAEQALAQARTAAREAKDAEDKRLAELAAAKKVVKVADAEVKQHTGDFYAAEKRADQIEERIDKPGLGIVHSDHGASASDMAVWKSSIIDVALLPMNTLRHLIDREALEIAVRKWMLAQPATVEARRMSGTVMEIVRVGTNR